MSGRRLWHEHEILAALEAGATLVTASERLARAARLTYADAQRTRGLGAWERPSVLSWHGFLISLFTQHDDALFTQAAATPRLLGTSQTGAVWETVVRESDTAGVLLQPAATAAAVQDAWKLCQDFRLSLEQIASYDSEDARQFTVWARAFCSRCETQNWLDEARLPQRLIMWLADGRFVAPKNLVFAGFDEWTPLQMDLLAALMVAGSEIVKLEVDSTAAYSAQRVICANADEELRAAAQWAAALLEQNPRANIGIVAQDLAACRERFTRTLDDALCAPARIGQDIRRPWNMSLGRPLGAFPLAFDALQLLEIGKRTLTFDTASRLLRSPFLAGAETEYAARARLELTLRKGGERISLKRWLDLAHHQGDVPVLAKALEATRTWVEAFSGKQLPSDWARQFGELLRLAGWPGERQTDSREYQTLNAFRELLGELARLDAVLGVIAYADAVARLAKLAADEIFQPAAEDVPVQVLGLLEAAGLQFDHLWVLGLSDDRWPASPRPNPLLPVALQRRHGLPHAGAQRELQFTQQVTARLLASAADVVVSTPARDADQDLRPSPLIAMLPEVELAHIPQRHLPAYTRFLHAAAPKLETFSDTRGPALVATDVRGGTAILKSQAACPFQAFARFRLGAEALETPAPGLDAKTRGILVHEVMEKLWCELGNQTQLAALNEAEREALIEQCVTTALHTVRAKWPEPFTPRFLILEKQRLQQLLRDWLSVELARAPFEIAELEKSHPVRIGPLAFTTRVDRIDRFADGGLAIIDYKTGDAKPSAWDGERPDEPQLPCYAVGNRENLAAVLFG
ncbi:MAG: PD-(D/E)XK nuclease family protein, partial [Gammaproteobacteria bacterium]